MKQESPVTSDRINGESVKKNHLGVKEMLAFIGGLFAGVFGILGNIFSKKSDYLLEFDDAKGTSAPKQEAAKTEAEPASVETPKAAKAKLSAAKKSEKVGQQPQPTAPKVAAPQPPVPKVKVPEKPEQLVLFAPNFLMPQPTARRRTPGPSMSMFRSMAKDMNLRK